MFENPHRPASEGNRCFVRVVGAFCGTWRTRLFAFRQRFEFTAQPIREWRQRLGVKTLFIEPGSPWENEYIESLSGKLRDELLNGEIFDTLLEAKIITERWRKQYNTIRPHSSLNYRPPASETYFLRQVANA